jgi:hypothetical protein
LLLLAAVAVLAFIVVYTPQAEAVVVGAALWRTLIMLMYYPQPFIPLLLVPVAPLVPLIDLLKQVHFQHLHLPVEGNLILILAAAVET